MCQQAVTCIAAVHCLLQGQGGVSGTCSLQSGMHDNLQKWAEGEEVASIDDLGNCHEDH